MQSPFNKHYSNSEIVFDYAAKTESIKEIETQMAAAGFWDNQESAQTAVASLKSLKAITTPLDELTGSVEDLSVLLEMCEEDPEMEDEVSSEIDRLQQLCEE